MRDFQKTQHEMALALIKGSNTASRVLSSSKTLADPQGALSRLNQSLTRWTGSATLAQWRVEAARGKLPKVLVQWGTVVEDIQEAATVAQRVSNPATLGPGLNALSRYTEVGILESRTALNHYNQGALAISQPLHRLAEVLHAQVLQSKGGTSRRCTLTKSLWPSTEALARTNLVLGQLASDLANRRDDHQNPCENDWKASWQAFNNALIDVNRKF
jgi:hypothetical protein